MVGERPGLLLGDDRILMHVHLDSGDENTTLVCFDFKGRQLWSQPNLVGWLSLPDKRFLVSTTKGCPLVIDCNGIIVWRGPEERIDQAIRHDEFLCFAGERHVWSTDLKFGSLQVMTWPEPGRPCLKCFVDGAFYWANGTEIRFCHPAGRSGTFVQLNTDLILDAKNRYKKAIGRYASNVPDLSFNFWKVSFDATRKLFFLANFLPHMILCLHRSGSVRWCEGLGPACCGGIPYALPHGLYVASGGCNGILSWFDADGHILFQSVPHEGEGLGTAYSNELQILSDGRILVGGGPGLAAYSADGPLLWVSKECSLRYCVDSANGLLACCNWRKNEGSEPSTAWLKVLDGL